MYITPAYASLLILLFIALSVRTVRLRRKLRIPIGDQGTPAMIRAMRVHANFAEYVPLTLLAMLMLELQGTSDLFVHTLGALLLVGRVAHAFGVSRAAEDYRYRVFGMAMTLSAVGMAAVALLIGYLWPLLRD
jgi:uncharacterized protein